MEGARGEGVKRKPRTDRQMESEKRRTTQCTSTLEHKRQTLSMSELRTRRDSNSPKISTDSALAPTPPSPPFPLDTHMNASRTLKNLPDLNIELETYSFCSPRFARTANPL